jgi:hypothetical protein
LVGNVSKLVETNNLLVKIAAIRSPLAAQDNQYRLAGALRLRLGLREV